MKLQDNVRAVVVKEVQRRDPVLTGALPDDASRIQNIIHKTPTQLPTYNNASRTRRTPPTPDDASRMQYRHKTCATSPGPGPIVYISSTMLQQIHGIPLYPAVSVRI